MPTSVPPWLVIEHGDAPIVLFAPHGGRRRGSRIPGEHKVNDLHTADVTRALALRLGASMVLNDHVDRNELDLNRTNQVRRDAPWLIEALVAMLRAKVAAWGRATVLVIHGWNVSQVACDLGIGMREGEDRPTEVRAGTGTVSATFVEKHLRPLQHLAASSGIAVTIGSRYPAAHPNNLLQLFRAGRDDPESSTCGLAALCKTAPVDAVQLELSIPLRWPGPRRDAFIEMLAEAFGSEPTEPKGAMGVRPLLRTIAGRVSSRRGLQFVAGESLVMISIEAGPSGTLGGRLVVSEDVSQLGLFTGELVPVDRAWSVPPLGCVSQPDGSMRITYEGPLVRFRSHTPFLDLEHGLAGGVLVEAALDVVFEPLPGAAPGESVRLGGVRGELVVDGNRRRVWTRGVATMVEPEARYTGVRGRIALPDAPTGALLLTMKSLQPAGAPHQHEAVLTGRLWTDEESVPTTATATITLASDPTLILESHEPDLRLRASLERIMPVLRPGPGGTVVETTYAMVRAGERSIGWLEMSVLRGVSEDRRSSTTRD